MSQDTSRKSISKHPTCLTGSGYDYISEEIGHREKIEFKRYVEFHIDDEEN